MKKTVKNVILTLLILTLSASTVILAYLHFRAVGDGELSGEWTASLDMTEQAAVAAFSWLQDIEAVNISLEEMESYMQGLSIQVHLSFEKTIRAEGTFHCSIQPESYEACSQAAYESFATVFRELLAERLHLAGYMEDMDPEAVEALVTETFGMSTVSYLKTYGPALLPSLEELQAGYEGSGTYKTAEGVLTRQFDDKGAVVTRSECYIRKGSSLVLTAEMDSADPDSAWFAWEFYPVLYTLEGTTE